jgi:hypothetical protein
MKCRHGALLMVGLPTDEFDWPYQVVLETLGGRTIGFHEDEDGRLCVLRNTPEGRPATPQVLLPAPAEVEAAARQWWAEHHAD